ncbi:hypothetical protein EKO27_g6740 [Xylaria grammica]|uniref:Uncharacterized protein n=1 Tax=Xylaria grammica TaxID=363999 RepID=A0A439D1T2_9PEZI|nr:hypothetical protein EKO27_g6740 [Xylaria grammica]
MSTTCLSAEVAPSLSDLIGRVLATVDSPDFEAWRSRAVKDTQRIVLQTPDGVVLWVQTDAGLEIMPPYFNAKHRINFEFMFREHAREWEGGWATASTPKSRTAFARIGYKGVIWQLSLSRA